VRRFHLIEIAEQPWCPAPIRDGVTDYLQFVIDRARPYAPAVDVLAETLEDEGAGGEVPILDLCSGAGGPWEGLVADLRARGVEARVRLTDLHPNREALARMERATGGRVTGELRPVRAEAVPLEFPGFRTAFTALHHFRPEQAREILADAARRGEGIAIFEATERSPRALLLTLLTPLMVLLGTPLIRPFRWSRLFWTYLLPAIPLVVLFDGLVSCLRSYSPGELQELAEGVDAEGYRWRSGTAGEGPIPVTWLTGTRAG
jgi:hypothetical protein